MSSSGNSEDDSQDYHHPIPYEEAGIHHVMAANGICVDTLRENQHPPIDVSVHSTTQLAQLITGPYLFSRHCVELRDMVAPSQAQGTRRYYCPEVDDATHGTMKWAVHLDRGDMEAVMLQGFQCKCCKTAPFKHPSSFQVALDTKYEDPHIAAAAVAGSLLYTTVNPVLAIDLSLVEHETNVHSAQLHYHSLQNFGPKQILTLVIRQKADGGYYIDDPIPPNNRQQLKTCVNCGFRNSEQTSKARKLIYRLSCRHYLCEDCIYWVFAHRESTHWIYGQQERQVPCKECGLPLTPILHTSLPGLTQLRAPIVKYCLGLKPIFSRLMVNAIKTFFISSISWFIDATNNDVVAMIKEINKIKVIFYRDCMLVQDNPEWTVMEQTASTEDVSKLTDASLCGKMYWLFLIRKGAWVYSIEI